VAKLALLCSVASLSLATSAFLCLHGMPQRMPITGAAFGSAALFGALYLSYRAWPRRSEASATGTSGGMAATNVR
jgi:hypothetical protein